MKRLVLILTLLLVASYVFAKVGGGDIVFKVGFGDVTFSHEKHVEMGFLCKACHPDPYVTKEKHKKVSMAEMNKSKSCGKCHNGKEAFTTKGNCKTCHVKK
ncbi:MAG: hypothetical protein OHK0040_06130 [bacterium]